MVSWKRREIESTAETEWSVDVEFSDSYSETIAVFSGHNLNGEQKEEGNQAAEMLANNWQRRLELLSQMFATPAVPGGPVFAPRSHGAQVAICAQSNDAEPCWGVLRWHGPASDGCILCEGHYSDAEGEGYIPPWPPEDGAGAGPGAADVPLRARDMPGYLYAGLRGFVQGILTHAVSREDLPPRRSKATTFPRPDERFGQEAHTKPDGRTVKR